MNNNKGSDPLAEARSRETSLIWLTSGNAEVTPADRSGPSESKCQDLFFALLFVGALIGIGVVVGAGWGDRQDCFGQPTADGGASGSDGDCLFSLDRSQLKDMLWLTVGSLAVATVATLAVFAVFRAAAKEMIYVGFGLQVALWVALAIIFFYWGQVLMGLLLCFCAAMTSLFLAVWRWRIPFAARFLETVVGVVREYPALLGVAFGGIVVAAAWMLAVVQALLSVAAFDPTGQVWALLFLSLAFIWGSQVIKNVVHVTCCGTFMAWYYYATDVVRPPNPTAKALRRTLTLSFGSVCLGSLLVAVIEWFRVILRAIRNQQREPNLVTCCLDCCLACASSALRFFNVWAYAVVARDGCSYVSAAKRTFRLWTNHGLSILVNDDITSATLSSFLLLIALLTGAAAAGGAWLWIDRSADDAGVVFMAFFIGFLVGLVEAAVFLEVIYAGVVAIMVSFCEAPNVLRVNQPELYREFIDAYAGRQALLPADRR